MKLHANARTPEAIEDAEIVEVSTPHLEDLVRVEDRYGRAVEPATLEPAPTASSMAQLAARPADRRSGPTRSAPLTTPRRSRDRLSLLVRPAEDEVGEGILPTRRPSARGCQKMLAG